MRVLITGATGFVGSHLVEAWHGAGDLVPRGLSVRALVRPTSDVGLLGRFPVERVQGSLTSRSSLRDAVAGVDLILHLGALTRARSEADFEEVNGGGTHHLLEAAKEEGRVGRFVYVSSLAAVGPAPGGTPVQPQTPPRPLTAYGRSKLAGEEVCMDAAGDMSVVILRPPAVYGPRERDLLIFFRLARLGILPVPTGDVRRLQMIHVSDLVRAIIAAGLTRDATGLFHVAESRAYTWERILDFVADAVGRRGRRVPLPRSLVRFAGGVYGAVGPLLGKPPIFDADKARELLAPAWLCETEGARRALGFEAAIPLERGMRETAEWYRKSGWLR